MASAILRVSSFFLLKNTDGKYFTLDEYKEKVKATQTDKEDKLICLYAANQDEQHSFIEAAKARSYDVLLLDTPLTAHLIGKLEQKLENTSFVRVDSDTLDNLIKKDEEIPSKLSEKEEEALKPIFEGVVEKDKFSVDIKPMDSSEAPVIITQSEFMRRMKEMQQSGGGGMFGAGNMPEMFNLVVNTNSEFISQILNTKTKKKQERLINQSLDLAKLSHGLLKGEELTNFINRSFDIIK